MKNLSRALIVDDEPSSRLNIRDLLAEEHIRVEEVGDGLSALEMVKQHDFDVVLLDIRLPKMDGLTVLKQINKLQQNLPVIIFTAHGTSDVAIEAMKLGAFDYLTKPFDIDELITVVHRALEHKRLSLHIQALQEHLSEVESGQFQPDQLVSKSSTMQEVFKMIGRVAPTDATVLIEGETGTGKELVANALWYHSQRRQAPFIKLNCAAIPEGLLESELFGHERGAFTGAETQRIGRFELAHNGTLFLDEVSEMSPHLQSKLLRVLEQSEFQRVGGKDTIHVDVRILAATNRNLREEVKAGRFRKDLFYRLQVVQLLLPPLRERKEDIPLLIEHFLKKYSRRRNLRAAPDVLERLMDYSWPGNIREIENIIQRATVLVQGNYITLDHLSLSSPSTVDAGKHYLSEDWYSLGLREILRNVEREAILKALQRAKWNKTKAAQLLQVDRRLLFTKIKEYNLKP